MQNGHKEPPRLNRAGELTDCVRKREHVDHVTLSKHTAHVFLVSSNPSEELSEKGRVNITLSEVDRILVTGTKYNVHPREGASGLAANNKSSSSTLSDKMELTDKSVPRDARLVARASNLATY